MLPLKVITIILSYIWFHRNLLQWGRIFHEADVETWVVLDNSTKQLVICQMWKPYLQWFQIKSAAYTSGNGYLFVLFSG